MFIYYIADLEQPSENYIKCLAENESYNLSVYQASQYGEAATFRPQTVV